MGRKRRERTKPEEEGEARNGGGNPSPGPRTTRSPAQDLGAAVAAVMVEERRGRQIWRRRAAKLLGAVGGRSRGACVLAAYEGLHGSGWGANWAATVAVLGDGGGGLGRWRQWSWADERRDGGWGGRAQRANAAAS